MEFKVGMQFEVTGDSYEKGDIIEITEIYNGVNGEYAKYKVVKNVSGYNSRKKRFGLNSFWTMHLKPVPVKVNECIVIYRKENETIALDKRTGKKAVAKCSQEDEYDFTTGAKLAFERLTGESGHVNCKCEVKPVYYTGKAVCVKSEDNDYIVGKIYEFTNGKITDENGCVRPKNYSMKEPEEYKEHTFLYDFIKLVE